MFCIGGQPVFVCTRTLCLIIHLDEIEMSTPVGFDFIICGPLEAWSVCRGVLRVRRYGLGVRDRGPAGTRCDLLCVVAFLLHCCNEHSKHTHSPGSEQQISSGPAWAGTRDGAGLTVLTRQPALPHAGQAKCARCHCSCVWGGAPLSLCAPLTQARCSSRDEPCRAARLDPRR